MERQLIRKVLNIEGMTCTGCEMRIEKALQKLDGVVEVRALYVNSQVYVTYDARAVGLKQISETIENLDYKVSDGTGEPPGAKAPVERMSVSRLLGIGVLALAIYVMLNTVGIDFLPEIEASMGYGVLFVVGLLTSLHCVAMCGGLNLSQCVSYATGNGRFSKLRPSLLYNAGRVISYTVIGGIVGALGSVISFSGAARGIVAVIAGVFMVIMGLNMLNVFPWLKNLNPRIPGMFRRKLPGGRGKRGPFYVGLLNGLMPCGPLQAMQLYALGTGSFAAGALSMFLFSMGTVPLMFGFGALSTLLSGKYTHKMMRISAVLVIALGLSMAGQGLALSGFSLPSPSFDGGSRARSGNVAVVQDGVQVVTTRLYSGRYEPITVQKGIPVRWVIKARKEDINGCNNEIIIPAFNKSKKLAPGDNIIEFTPTETGTFVYSCWMGMIRSKIVVVDDINNIGTGGEVRQSDYRIPVGKAAAAVIKEKQVDAINPEANRFFGGLHLCH